MYGGLSTVDLWVGGLAEQPIPGGVVGPTFTCLFAITFSDLRDGDRFWYENNIFTPQQFKRTSLAKILCDNGDAISSVQPNAFVLNSRQQSCSSIPGINLSAWRDESLCFQRVRIEPHTRDFNVYFQSVLPNSQQRSFPLLQRNSYKRPLERCVPFVCPTNSRNTYISNFPSDYSNFLACEVTANTNMPRSQANLGSAYEAMLTTQTLQASNGLYRDLNSCKQSTTVAIDDLQLPPLWKAIHYEINN